MSPSRTIAKRQVASALTDRRAGAGPFSDATNKIGAEQHIKLATEKPVSRRAARNRGKRSRGNGTRHLQTEELAGPTSTCPVDDTAPILPANVPVLAPAPTPPPQNHPPHLPPLVKSPSGWYAAPPTPAFDPGYSAQYSPPPVYTPRPIPTLIVRTIPGAPPKKFYGPYEACSRADLLVEETPRTWEEDMWGIVYSDASSKFAVSVAGLIEVVTIQAPPGDAGSVQIFYG
ncbi:hypothetical protein FB451DRAFT_1467726 [Mycena latifolia]|nr:hypothetical protein FB451DRAFT_1467726 [Mycena latifolia]